MTAPAIPRADLVALGDDDPAGEACGACHAVFPTLAEVFSHDCPGLRRAAVAALPTPGAAPGAKTNRYDAPCADCGLLVPNGAGSLAKVDGRWLVRHWPLRCPSV